MKKSPKYVNNNKNVVNVIIQNPQKKHNIHKSKSHSEPSNDLSYRRPNISVPFTNTSNLENEILREQLNNIKSNRNPQIYNIGQEMSNRFRNPFDADDSFIKMGSDKEVTDVHSDADLYDVYSQSSKSFNMPDDVFDRLRQPLYTPTNSINSSNNSIFSSNLSDISNVSSNVSSQNSLPNNSINSSNNSTHSSNFTDITEKTPPPKAVELPPKVKKIKINPMRPKPMSQMNKNELKEEYKNLTGQSAGKMTKKQLLNGIKSYKFRSPK